MREIKFRAIQNNKILGRVETDPVFNGGAFFIIDYAIDESERKLDCCVGRLFPNFKNANSLDKITYDQYTGLKDKNGKEIYFDDLMVAPSGSIFRVIWDDEIMSIKLLHDGCKYNFNAPLYEIIGNIYENPELLK